MLLLNQWWYQGERSLVSLQLHHSNPSRSVSQMNKEATNARPVYPGSNCSVKTFLRQHAKWKDILRIQKLKPTFSYNYWLFSTLFPSFYPSYSRITTSKLHISFPVHYKILWLMKIIEKRFAKYTPYIFRVGTVWDHPPTIAILVEPGPITQLYWI